MTEEEKNYPDPWETPSKVVLIVVLLFLGGLALFNFVRGLPEEEAIPSSAPSSIELVEPKLEPEPEPEPVLVEPVPEEDRDF